MPISRRSFLTASGLLLGSAALAGCGTNEQGSSTTHLLVYSWWIGDGEEAGLRAMVEDFELKNPDIVFVNEAVQGGAGGDAKAVLAQRLKANDPPDTFQGHAGAELSDYIKAGQIEDISSLIYSEEEWERLFPRELREQLTVNGKIYSVPVNIHRANVLWSNTELLEAAGVSRAPADFDAFFDALDKIKARGKIPLATGERWTIQHLMETVLLGVLGINAYKDLWTSGRGWEGGKLKEALTVFKDLLEYTENPSSSKLTWQECTRRVGEGKAGFMVMGDWADTYFANDLALTPETAYGWAPTPGTDGVYQYLSDSFTLPVGAPHREAAIAWLKYCGSKEGQDKFNPKKGSIPARFDAGPKLYGPYLQWALKEWRKNKIAGSLTHGTVASLSWTGQIDKALETFLKDGNLARFQDALAAAAAKHVASA